MSGTEQRVDGAGETHALSLILTNSPIRMEAG